MKRIAAVIVSPKSDAHSQMAAEALRKAASTMGYTITVETHGAAGTQHALSQQAIADADVVIIAADTNIDTSPYAGKPVYATRTSEAIRHTTAVIDAALALAAPRAGTNGTVRVYEGGNGKQAAGSIAQVAVYNVPRVAAQPSATAVASHVDKTAAATLDPAPAPPQPGGKRLVGITSCPTGIAHTFMAAEALQKAAKSLGHTIKVETQGSVGAKNQLTDDDIANADAVVIAADTKVDTSRFAGKPIYTTSTKEAMHHGQQVVQTALEQPAATQPAGAPGTARGATLTESVERAKAERSASRTGPYKHLMTGVSYMLPIIVAGGLSIALAFAFGGILAPGEEYAAGTLAAAFSQIGGAAFGVFVGVLAAFIAYSIADRPGIAPGLIGGLLANALGAGFLGGIVAGFLAGYLTKFLADNIRLPATLAGLMPVLILPFLGTVIVGLLMVYLIGPPVAAALSALTAWLQGLRSGNAVILGLILGAMMAFDMGGPVNKAAYTFALGLLGSQINTPIAAAMAAGMTPPLGLALAAFLFRNRFDAEEREAAKPAIALGAAFITEGAIPFAAKDPLRVIPALMLGSATAGALSMFFDVGLRAPHGGIFAMLIPNAVIHLVPYLGAIAAGTVVTALALFILKRPITRDEPQMRHREEQAVTV